MIDEGYIKFRSAWTRTAPLSHPEIAELLKWRRPLYAAELIGHYPDLGIGYGNLSIRAGEAGQFIISATQTGHLPAPGVEHFALVTGYDMAANTVQSEGAAEASSESMTHAALYALNGRIGAVVHVHNDALWHKLKGKIATTGADVAYGTPEMAAEFKRLYDTTEFADSGIAVMAGHDSGLIATGTSLADATQKMLALHAQHQEISG